MDFDDQHCHTASTLVDRPAEVAFAFMSDGLKQTRWALGSWDRRKVGTDLFVGTSLFTGKETYVRLAVDAANFVVLYHVGPSPEALQPRNMARVVPGPAIGRDPGCCVVTLMTWRAADAPDERWRLTCVSHKTEMYMIRHLIESGG
jgi:hypothetical protein